MELIELKSNMRTKTGTGPARSLRRCGKIPAILYGPETEPILLSVEINDLEQTLKKGRFGQMLINVVINNGQTLTKTAMIKELQTDPVTNNYLHLDLYEIVLDRKIKVNIPVVTKGKSKGVESGGILQVIRRDLEVLCLPQEIPEAIEIDVTDLDIGDSVHINEVPLEGNVEIPADVNVNFTVVTIVSPKIEAEAKLEEEEEAGEIEETEEAGVAEKEGAKSETE